MNDDMVPEPCELNCIMQLIDPVCEKCDAWYQYWADIDSSDEECSNLDCTCREVKNE